jgi:hypothetical protein
MQMALLIQRQDCRHGVTLAPGFLRRLMIQGDLAVSFFGIPPAYLEVSTATCQSHHRIARKLSSQWHVRRLAEPQSEWNRNSPYAGSIVCSAQTIVLGHEILLASRIL